jgi:inosine-uridine nucleoside N-ribohydrolase
MMGGCVYPEKIHGRLGNIQVNKSDEWAEYNFAVDPEAAQIVFNAGFEEICLIPLEVTRSVLYNHKIDKRLRALNLKIAQVAANILSTVGAEDKKDYASIMAFDDDPVRAIHDVVAMAYLTDPDLFEIESLPLKIMIDPPPAGAGQSIVDKDNYDHPSVTVIRDLDREKFFDRIVEYLSNL